jgi:HEAT repeat protein
MRRWAIKFLGDNRDEESFDKIQQLALSSETSDPDIKRDAFTALYNIDPGKARNLLIGYGLRSQRDHLVRERAVDLLGNYPPDEELIQQMLAQSTDSSWGVRQKVCEVLGRWRDGRAIHQLRMMLSDSEPQVSMAAVEALNRFSEGQVEPELREEAQEALDRIEG